jgi:hypothetical protein
MDSSDSGTPPSREPIGAKEKRRAGRRRQESERERRKDRKPGGQPGHPGRGLSRDPDPGERKSADPPAQCRRCGTGLDGAAGTSARLAGRPEDAGFDEAMRAALDKEPVLAADETPVNVLAPDTDPGTGEVVPGAAQVMVIRTPAERLVWLQALASRRAVSAYRLTCRCAYDMTRCRATGQDSSFWP